MLLSSSENYKLMHVVFTLTAGGQIISQTRVKSSSTFLQDTALVVAYRMANSSGPVTEEILKVTSLDYERFNFKI